MEIGAIRIGTSLRPDFCPTTTVEGELATVVTGATTFF